MEPVCVYSVTGKTRVNATGKEIVESKYSPISHCLAVVKIGNDYLIGWNKWRQDWEIFGGCREDNETLKEYIVRECNDMI